jgi:hypothetical protein
LLNGARHAANVLEPVLYSIPLSIWVSDLGASLEDETAYWSAIRDLGPKNGLILATLAVIVAMEIVKARREERLRRRAAADVLKTERSAQRVLLALLSTANAAVSQSLGVVTNVRYMPVEVDGEGNKALVQARDLHIEQVRMPSEYGFTRLSVDDPAIISGRSFRTKSPIYEELPVDHMDQYSPDVATMIDARQRWVLACPVLSIDGVAGDLRRDDDPHGVLVFYGVDVPQGENIEEEIRNSLSYAQKAAEAFSFVLEIGDAVGDLAG